MAEPPATPEPYVFLSYTSVDRDRVLTLADRLETVGIRVWVDRRSLVGGMSWDAAIVRAIKDCTVFAVLCTPASVRSPNVMQELRLAWEEQRPTLPLLLAPVSFPDEMRYILAGRQWVELLDRTEDAWLPDLHNALAGLGVVASRPHTAAVPTPVPVPPPTNLPAALTRFLGREHELADLAALLANTRLLTLTGPGGTGKTQLAISAAAAQVAAFPDGVFFVDLAPLQEPTLVPSAVAQSLGVQTLSEVPVRDSVLRFVRDKQLLVVLDNYEHLLAAAEFAGALLQAAPGIHLLVTSRAPLRVRGEREYAVAPLPVPAAGTRSTTALGQNPSVQLFVLRAQAIRTDFVLSAENAASVAAICTRLDGLPLAIELAAARVRALPPAALLARLEQRLPLLTGGRRDMPARQQTLRDAIAWSYDLLEPAEQQLFSRLAVFAGGCTLELVEAVCNANGDLGLDILDGVSSLLEKSLLRLSDNSVGEPRYRMLETIREFALGALETSGEAETVRRQLAVQVLHLVRQCVAASDWQHLDAEIDNARAVLGWCVERGELAVGVRLLWVLPDYFRFRGILKEQESWRQRLLALPAAKQPNGSRARLLGLATVDFLTVDFPAVEQQEHLAAELEEAIGLSRALEDQNCLAQALRNRAFLFMAQDRFADVDPPAEEAFVLLLAADRIEAALNVSGFRIGAAIERGDIATAEALFAANRAVAQARGTLWLCNQEAELAEARDDVVDARRLLEELVRMADAEQGENGPVRLAGLVRLAVVALRQDDTRAVAATCTRSLEFHRRVGPSRFLPVVLSVLCQAAERRGLFALSACLFAATSVRTLPPGRVSTDLLRSPVEQRALIGRLRTALGGAAFAEVWAEGEALSADAAIELGLAAVAALQQLLATDTVVDPLT